MKYRNFNIPIGVPILGTPKKHFDPISALVGLGSSIFGDLFGSSVQSAFTEEQQKLQSRLNREEMAYSQGLQQSNQEWLMNRQYPAMTSGMKNAGLNPATANGTSPATPALAHPSTGGTGPSAGKGHVDPIGSAIQAMSMESLGQDIKSKKLANKRSELELKRMQDEYDWGNRQESQVFDPDTGELIASDDFDDYRSKIDAWSKLHPGKTPELRTVKHSYGREQMRQQESEWKTQDVERGMRRASALLDTAIRSGQLKDKEVMDAFIKLPANEKKTLEKVWRAYNDDHDIATAQKEFQKLQNQDFKATSFGSLVATLKDENLGFFEKSMATLGFLANKFLNNTSFSFGFSKSSSRSRSYTESNLPTVHNHNTYKNYYNNSK